MSGQGRDDRLRTQQRSGAAPFLVTDKSGLYRPRCGLGLADRTAKPGAFLDLLVQNPSVAVLISLIFLRSWVAARMDSDLAEAPIHPSTPSDQLKPPGRGRERERETFSGGSTGPGGVTGGRGTAITLKAIDQRSPSPRNGATEWGCQAGKT
jgi:hypothetical protein